MLIPNAHHGWPGSYPGLANREMVMSFLFHCSAIKDMKDNLQTD